jgi:hypothetical protein
MIDVCQYCNSVNHIFVDNPYANAWECWNCFTKHWIDEDCKRDYVLNFCVEPEVADDKLQRGDYTIHYLLGSCQHDSI